MSRSYRHTPILKYCPVRGRIGKQFANRKVRRYDKELTSGSMYKKLFCAYDIHDCITYETLNMALDNWSEKNWRATTLQGTIREWKKLMFWK